MTYAGKLQKVVTMYLAKCTDSPAFKGGKPSREYWQVRGYFFKQDPDIVNITYDYLSFIQGKMISKPWEIIDKAKAYQTELRWEEAKEEIQQTQTQCADDYSFDSLMNL